MKLKDGTDIENRVTSEKQVPKIALFSININLTLRNTFKLLLPVNHPH